MARYCVAFKSMQQFLSLRGSEQLEDLLSTLSLCQEFDDVHLRVNEKRVLNTLNKDKNHATIRSAAIIPGQQPSGQQHVVSSE